MSLTIIAVFVSHVEQVFDAMSQDMHDFIMVDLPGIFMALH